jgi:hypothetical protein
MRRRYILAAVAVVILVALVAWDRLSPAMTVRSVVAAAKSNDAEKLASYIDFPALKADFKAEFNARLDAEMKRDSSPAVRMQIALARSMMEPVINNIASINGLRAVLAALDESDAPPASRQPGKMKIIRTGFNSFRVARDVDTNRGFVFTRHGLGWKLSGVDLPAAPPAPPTRS